MGRLAITRYLALTAVALMMAVLAGCGGGDPDTTEAPSISQGRWAHSATLLEDGRVLIVGGHETASGKLETAEIYDPASQTWSSAGSMSDKRGEGHSTTLLSDGRVLVFGETDEPTAEVYDPATNEWSLVGSLSQARTSASSTLLPDGRVLVAGGLDATKAGQERLDTVEVFDPATGEWSQAANMNQVHSNHKALLLEDGTVFLAGGMLTEIYDPEADTWTSAGTPDRERSWGYTADLLNDGKILVTGGVFLRGGWQGIPSAPIRNAELYDFEAGAWTRVADMNEPRGDHAAALLQDGKVLVVAGAELEMYDPNTDTWQLAGKLATERDLGEPLLSATVLNDGTVLVVGGKGEVEERARGLASVEIYDPATFEAEE
jgi:N-acetylneuraminic acid mutarotase